MYKTPPSVAARLPNAAVNLIIIIIIIITDIYKAPILLRAHRALQIYTTSTIHNTQTTIASNHV